MNIGHHNGNQRHSNRHAAKMGGITGALGNKHHRTRGAAKGSFISVWINKLKHKLRYHRHHHHQTL